MKGTLLSVESASFGYRSGGKAIVNNVQFSVENGDFIILRGPNGCGKSTIVKGLLGSARVLEGNVVWTIEKTRVGYVPQETSLSGGIPYTVFDIVYYSTITSRSLTGEMVMRALAAVEMDTKCGIRFCDLSGGQKRRVLFARALARNPRMLILDEPTANVDIHTEKVIEQLIGDITSGKEAAVLAVAHATDFARNARVLHVENGRCHG